MTALTSLAAHPFAQALSTALLHFLWQGAVLALAAFLLFAALRRSAQARYLVGVVTLALMFAAPVATTAWLLDQPADVSIPATTVGAATWPDMPAGSVATSSRTASSPAAPVLPLFVLATWTCGVLILSIRLLGGWVAARRVAARLFAPVPPAIDAAVNRLAAQLGLRRAVRVVESATVHVPIMIGWLKPIVILPTAVVSGFSPAHVEALVVHELAHVRRHDYLVNLLQTVVETVLFYQPAVWWISRRVRAEREHCCDDVAVTVCDRLVYARALSDLAELVTPSLAMAASGGSLVERVRRILGRPPEATERGSGWVSVFVILALAAPVLSAPLTRSATPQAAPTSSAPARASAPETKAGPPQDQAPTSPVAVFKDPAPEIAARGNQKRTPEIEVPADQSSTDIEMLKVKLKELTDAQDVLDRQRAELEQAQVEAHVKAQLEELQAELAVLRDKYSEMKRRVDVGMASSEQLSAIEAQLRQVQRRDLRGDAATAVRRHEREAETRDVEAGPRVRPGHARVRAGVEVARRSGLGAVRRRARHRPDRADPGRRRSDDRNRGRAGSAALVSRPKRRYHSPAAAPRADGARAHDGAGERRPREATRRPSSGRAPERDGHAAAAAVARGYFTRARDRQRGRFGVQPGRPDADRSKIAV